MSSYSFLYVFSQAVYNRFSSSMAPFLPAAAMRCLSIDAPEFVLGKTNAYTQYLLEEQNLTDSAQSWGKV